MYYLRTKAAVNAIQFTVTQQQKAEPTAVAVETEEMSAEEFRAMIERSKMLDQKIVKCGS